MKLSFFKHIEIRSFLIAVVVFVLAFASVYFSRSIRLTHPEAVQVTESLEFFIYEPVNVRELMVSMEAEGFVFNRDELDWAAGILGWSRFLPGRYLFDGGYTYQEFLEKLALGLQDPVSLRVPAGASKAAVKTWIARQMIFSREELETTMTDSDFLGKHGLEEHQLYGRLLPDTYQVFWTSSPERVLDRLLQEFDRRIVEPYGYRLDELGRSIDEITTLASIIEWEARFDHEKPAISGLYWNRLNRRWRLQADPTVNYAKGERGRLIYADYSIDHPYNTYRIHGLPPGPITNPSFASLRAALFPEEHDYMFMVATPEGTHAFSRTYAEHRRKSREWTNWLRQERQRRAEMERQAAMEGAAAEGQEKD
ncbi:endolytic transglycosylase MltG [Balneolaceae bacterium ANBcel3]|nr:endolytic transglycosylase MltG [Balneolaceae bacterium ANBcel3]